MDRSPYTFRENRYGMREPLFQGQPTTREQMLAEQQIQQAMMEKSWPLKFNSLPADDEMKGNWGAASDIDSNIRMVLEALRR